MASCQPPSQGARSKRQSLLTAHGPVQHQLCGCVALALWTFETLRICCAKFLHGPCCCSWQRGTDNGSNAHRSWCSHRSWYSQCAQPAANHFAVDLEFYPWHSQTVLHPLHSFGGLRLQRLQRCDPPTHRDCRHVELLCIFESCD